MATDGAGPGPLNVTSTDDRRAARNHLEIGFFRNPLLVAEGLLPSRDDDCRQAVADDIHRCAGHVHQFVDSENDDHSFDRQMERRERAKEDDERCSRHYM